MDRVKQIHHELVVKYKRTTRMYRIINVSAFFGTALVIILNIFAIRMNPTQESTTIWLFVSVAILTALTAFFSSILSFFVYRKRNKDISEKITKIELEKEDYKNNAGEYEKTNNNERLLIERITEIISG